MPMQRSSFIDLATAEELWARYETPEHVARHCAMVAQVAAGLTATLNRCGYRFSEEIIFGAALTHDIARVQQSHEKAGAEILKREGYPEEAAIVLAHMHHSIAEELSLVREVDLVCLADRMVLEDRFVGLADRMAYVLQKWKGDPEAERVIRQKIRQQEQLIREIESVIGRTLEELLEEKGIRTHESPKAHKFAATHRTAVE